MLVLGIDTAARRGGVALADGDRILASRRIEAPKGFGDVLYTLIEELLAEAGAALGEIELFAAASGPGSFTGVRVGLTAAKALGEALGRPVVGVSNLAALAAAADRDVAQRFSMRAVEKSTALFSAKGSRRCLARWCCRGRRSMSRPPAVTRCGCPPMHESSRLTERRRCRPRLGVTLSWTPPPLLRSWRRACSSPEAAPRSESRRTTSAVPTPSETGRADSGLGRP